MAAQRIADRFRELVAKQGANKPLVEITASLQDLLDLATIIDEELAKAGLPQDASELVEKWGHTEGR